MICDCPEAKEGTIFSLIDYEPHDTLEYSDDFMVDWWANSNDEDEYVDGKTRAGGG